tara:strand:+ start:715 stop:927 length:213 start_codon:yes stop_codon:yes gene_type:complete
MKQVKLFYKSGRFTGCFSRETEHKGWLCRPPQKKEKGHKLLVRGHGNRGHRKRVHGSKIKGRVSIHEAAL